MNALETCMEGGVLGFMGIFGVWERKSEWGL